MQLSPLHPHNSMMEEAIDVRSAAAGAAFGNVSQLVLSMLPSQRSAWRLVAPLLANTPGSPATGRLRVAVMGGSVPAGRECTDGDLKAAQCAFPQRLVKMLNASRLLDMTVGGVPISGFLPSVPMALSAQGLAAPRHPTLLLADWSINDAVDTFGHRSTQLVAALEAFLRFTLTEVPAVPLVLVQTSFDGSPHPNAMAAAYSRVASHYGVPLFRYGTLIRNTSLAWQRCCPPLHLDLLTRLREAAACSNKTGTLSFRGKPFACIAHPPASTHQLIAQSLHLSLLQLARRLQAVDSPVRAGEGGADSMALPSPLSSADTLAKQPICRTPLSRHDVPTVADFAPTARGWEVHEDHHGKCSWVARSLNATMELPLTFGDQPRIMISYVLGYDLHGEVQISLRGITKTSHPPPKPRPSHANVCRISAARQDGLRVTQVAVASFIAAEDHMQNYASDRAFQYNNGLMGFGVPPNSKATLVVRFLGCSTRPVAGDAATGVNEEGSIKTTLGEPCVFMMNSVLSC